MEFYFICLYYFTVIIAPLASLINLLLYYIILMVQPFLSALVHKKEKLPNYLSLFYLFPLFSNSGFVTTFFSVIISSYYRGSICKSNWAIFYIINSISVLFMLKNPLIILNFNRDFKDSSFKKRQFKRLIFIIF